MQPASTEYYINLPLGKFCYICRKSNTAGLTGAPGSELECEEFQPDVSCPHPSRSP